MMNRQRETPPEAKARGAKNFLDDAVTARPRHAQNKRSGT